MFANFLTVIAAGPDRTAPFFPRTPGRFLLRLLAGLVGLYPLYWLGAMYFGPAVPLVWLVIGLWINAPRRA